MTPTRIQYYQRKQGPGHFSLERVFEAVRKALPADIAAEVHTCRFNSRGILPRIFNVVEAALRQRDLNHIVGDVHYLAFGLRKPKTILTIHDCGVLRFRSGLRRQLLLWLWFRLPVERVAAVTAISEFTRDEVLRYTGCDPAIVHVIPDPLPDGFVPWPKNFRQQVPIILQVGTAPNKNISRVAEALCGIPCRLEIIGRLSAEDREAVQRNGISFTEQWGLSDQEVINRYRECDMVMFASVYEGFGMPILEANATGRPVVTSNIAPMSEVAGSAACFVEPYDCYSIREGILRVINDEAYRNRLVEQGFENTKRFRAATIATQYAALYRSVSGMKSQATSPLLSRWSKWARR